MRRSNLLILVLACGVVAATAAAYLPGLHGDFLFDDYVNLPLLGAEGRLSRWPAFLRYITSGFADPTGRPLALLSFLVDAQDWPADPYPFKRTNLVLHLINGVLLMCLLRRLGHALSRTTASTPHLELRLSIASVLGATFWMLHPLLVSTTLYVVQREAMLPATFTLAGLLFWLLGRERMLQGRTAAGFVWMMLGLGACTALAVLSKANGVLLPMLAVSLELSVLSMLLQSVIPPASQLSTHARCVQRYRRAFFCFAWLPTLAIVIYIVHIGLQQSAHPPGSRPWTIEQRLLTEPRVVFSYLKLLWVPRPFSAGVFNDQIRASSSLFSPGTTLPSLFGVIALLGFAWFARARAPALSASLLFYFAGQALESTTIPLELYFEHRNYLPAMLMFWPLSLWLSGVPQITAPAAGASLTLRKPIPGIYRAILAGGLIAVIGWMTYERSRLWGNPHDQALLWAALNPDSPRAQANAAQAELSAGRPEDAERRLKSALHRLPADPQLTMNLFSAECQQGRVTASTLDLAYRALADTPEVGGLMASWFERLIAQSATPICPEAGPSGIRHLLEAVADNKRLMALDGRRQDLYYLRGQLALSEGDSTDALTAFDRALDQQVRPGLALRQAAALGAAGYPAQGLQHLDYYEQRKYKTMKPSAGMASIHEWVLHRQHYWDNEVTSLRQTLVGSVADKENKIDK